jgi:hypothetical protein
MAKHLTRASSDPQVRPVPARRKTRRRFEAPTCGVPDLDQHFLME